ncbi:hypothetical protein [Legionella drancourtii]|uniref:Periplasmic protein n=1 Tax=Legionella drancourtii LLAP12 TaxID=658187 RepID=G9EIS1_9GAMM|nr:hypothetical protein [Legionella drancourtii]EHL32839.1 hypothetical protein LDG_5077 [Legionella drancourtii LLAP12]
MLRKLLVLSVSWLFSSPLWAITCYYTLAKDNCWLKYNVTVDVMDALSAKVLATVTVPAGKSWTRVTFPCETNGQKLMYRAQFSPSIWDSEKGKVYMAKNYWSLPNGVKEGDSAWNVSVCYPSDFSEVPMTPEATSSCACDFSSIPEIPPKKL